MILLEGCYANFCIMLCFHVVVVPLVCPGCRGGHFPYTFFGQITPRSGDCGTWLIKVTTMSSYYGCHSCIFSTSMSRTSSQNMLPHQSLYISWLPFQSHPVMAVVPKIAASPESLSNMSPSPEPLNKMAATPEPPAVIYVK